MEHNDMNIFETKLDETAKAHLLETTRWTKFLAIIQTLIIVIVCVSFIILYATVGNMAGGDSTYAALGLTIMVVACVIGIALCVYPIYALFKFSSCMKRGINTNDQTLINDGFRHQKGMFRYLGILTIIYLVLVLISFIFSGIQRF